MKRRAGDASAAWNSGVLQLERFRLSRARVPQQHVGAFGAEFGQRGRAAAVAIDHGHGARDDQAPLVPLQPEGRGFGKELVQGNPSPTAHQQRPRLREPLLERL